MALDAMSPDVICPVCPWSWTKAKCDPCVHSRQTNHGCVTQRFIQYAILIKFEWANKYRFTSIVNLRRQGIYFYSASLHSTLQSYQDH